MNSNKHRRILLVGLGKDSKGSLDLKDSKINLDNRVADSKVVNLVIYLKNLKNSLAEEANKEEVHEVLRKEKI